MAAQPGELQQRQQPDVGGVASHQAVSVELGAGAAIVALTSSNGPCGANLGFLSLVHCARPR